MFNVVDMTQYELNALLIAVSEEIYTREIEACMCDSGIAKIDAIVKSIHNYVEFNDNRQID